MGLCHHGPSCLLLQACPHSAPYPSMLQLLELFFGLHCLVDRLLVICPQRLGFLVCCDLLAGLPVPKAVGVVLPPRYLTDLARTGASVVAGLQLFLGTTWLRRMLGHCPRLPPHRILCVACKHGFKGGYKGFYDKTPIRSILEVCASR